jgi:glucuronokinase
MIIRKKSYSRAGLIGNPSDGYFGKTIAFTFKNFCAEVVLYETPELEIQPNIRDHSRFGSLEALVDDVQLLAELMTVILSWCALPVRQGFLLN